jgi:hypothetical protein
MTSASSGAGVMPSAVNDQAPLLCSDFYLVCSDDLDCSEIGPVTVTAGTGTLVAA